MTISELENQITQLKNDRIHGAHLLSLKALNILNLAIEESNADTAEGLLQDLTNASKAIATARPSMVSISNYVNYYLSEISRSSTDAKHLDTFKHDATIRLRRLIKYNKEAPLKAAKIATALIKDGATVIICSYSSTICTMLKIASRTSGKINVIIMESKWNGFDYGKMSLRELAKNRIPATIKKRSELDSSRHSIDIAFIGCDTIFPDGSLINGAPSLLLAKFAETAHIGFYSVGEIVKFDSREQFKTLKVEPGFDLVPHEMITGIVTEKGIIEPERISDLKYKWIV